VTTAGVEAPTDKSLLERLLAPIVDVRRGEAVSAGLNARLRAQAQQAGKARL